MQKQPLVLIPGLLCDALVWQHQIAGLAEVADCWVANHTARDTMAGIAADILASAPFQRFSLAGLSMGGYLSLEIMRQAPQRVRSLALLDTSARADTPEQGERRAELVKAAQQGHLGSVIDALTPLLIARFRGCDVGLTATIRAMGLNTGAEAFVRQERAILSRIDSRPHLAAIRCPTLVLCGKQDLLTPRDRHEEMAGAIPGAELAVVDDCGHLSTLEQPEEVNKALVAWLARMSA